MASEPWFHKVPNRLRLKGIDQQTWQTWMSALCEVQSSAKQCDALRCFCCLFCVPWIIPNPAYTLCNCLPWSNLDPFQINMKKWLKNVNVVLEPKGAFVKAFCAKSADKNGADHKDNSLAFLAFALTPGKINELKNEKVLQEGNTADGGWGCWCCLSHRGRVV